MLINRGTRDDPIAPVNAQVSRGDVSRLLMARNRVLGANDWKAFWPSWSMIRVVLGGKISISSELGARIFSGGGSINREMQMVIDHWNGAFDRPMIEVAEHV